MMNGQSFLLSSQLGVSWDIKIQSYVTDENKTSYGPQAPELALGEETSVGEFPCHLLKDWLGSRETGGC